MDRQSCALIAVLVASSCTGVNVNPEGRPCAGNIPCGPGTVCNQTTWTCVAQVDARPDAWRVDGRRPDTSRPDGRPADGRLLDSRAPDSFRIPDAGCPAGYAPCGVTCVNLSSDVKHCGACSNACPASISDSCVGGNCVCGGTGGPCSGALSCTAGTCQCVAGCLIQGVCYADGATKPMDPCKKCVASEQATAWSPASGCVVSLAGTGAEGYLDGPVASAMFHYPLGMVVDPSGKIYVADSDNHRIRMISGGVVSTFAGSGTPGFQDGAASSARFTWPADVALDGTGKLYVVDNGGHRIRVIAGGIVSTVAGTGVDGFKDGPALQAQFNEPASMIIDSAGVMYVTDGYNNRVRTIASGVVSTLAGSGTAGFLDGPASSAQFSYPIGIARDGSGTIYIGDANNNRIRMLSGGMVSTIAGSGTAGYQNGAAGSAQFSFPVGVTLDGSGKIYVGDTGNNRIRVISAGQVSTYSGGLAGLVDGPLGTARFSSPNALLFVGGLGYVPDSGNNAIRVIRP